MMDKHNFTMSYSIDKTFDSDQFLKLRLRVCHDGESPNKTFFTKETMAEANKSLEYIPILAHTYVDEETGKPVIGSHDMHIEEDKLNEGESRIIYDEIPIGVIPSLADNNCAIEEYNGLNYTYVDGYVWRDYANYAEQLIEDAENNKISMEIDFSEDSLSYDAANERYNIASYRYRGVTMLNEKLGTGMKDALATTTNFSANDGIKEKMIVLMEELQKCLREYDTNDSDEKGVEKDMKLNELLEKYGLSVEDLDFEYENLDDEALGAAFEDYANRHMESDENSDDNEDSDNDEGSDDDEASEGDNSEGDEGSTGAFSESENEPLVCSFRISHDDTRYGLQSLLNAMCDESHFYSVLAVYDKYFYYCDYFSGDAFKQAYKVRKDVVSFSGDPEPVFTEFVTQAERDELEKLRKDYAELKEFKENVEASELKDKKDAIFAREEYSVLAEDEAFKTLQTDAINFSVEEVETKAKAIFADYVIKAGEFSAKKDDKKSKTLGFNFGKNSGKSKKPYGDLFPDK
jgi:hypothetical protein